MSRAVIVTGATGKQGGAVLDALIDANADFEILAVSRNVQSVAAQKLKQKSPKVKPMEGDMNNPIVLFKTAQKVTSLPIWGVFSVQAPMASGQNVALEERQGKGMVDEAIKAGVKFFVYTSVDRGGSKSYDNPTNVPHFASKHNVEHHLVEKAEGTEMRWLILRPVAFFDNLTPSYFGKIFATALQVGLKGKPLQYIATSDIGHFAAQGFLKPEEYSGKSISLAGDSLTHDQMAAIFKEKTGKNFPSTFKFLANALLSMSKDMGAMFKWFHDEGYGADIDELKKVHPGLKDFSAWLEKDSQFMKR